MLYKKFLKTQKDCPFCILPKSQLIKENSGSYLTVSIAPYHKHHLLVIPKRHFEKILDASSEEIEQTLSLIKEGILFLSKLGYQNYCLLLRQGNNLTARSVPHLHYHIIPDTPVGMIDGHSDREVLTEKEIENVLSDFKLM